MELWWRLLSYLTLIDKVTLTYANKELYFIVHSNQNLKRELDFVKCIAKNNNWENFLNIKFDEILNNFRQKVYCGENVYSYINLRFLFVSMKRNLCKSDIYSHMFIVCVLMIILLIVSIAFVATFLVIVDLLSLKSKKRSDLFICLGLR